MELAAADVSTVLVVESGAIPIVFVICAVLVDDISEVLDSRVSLVLVEGVVDDCVSTKGVLVDVPASVSDV